jgi:AsmA protein
MALAGTFQSGTPSGTFEAVQIPRLALSVQGRGTRSLQADVSADVQVAPSAARATVDRLALEARLEEPGLAPMQVAATGQARASATASSLELKGRFNQDPFEARVQATLGGKVPQIEASARFQALDLDRLLPRAAAAGASAPAGGAAAAADTPVDLAALRRLDARFDLAVGDLRRAPYRVGELALQGRLAGGELQLTTLRGRTWGGRFDLAARADARRADSQRLSLRGQVDEVDIRAALKDVLGREDVEGRGRVTLDLAAQGASVAALKASLAGQMALRLRDGAVRGFNIARALREARAALTLQRDAVQRARQAEKTDFSELTASFQFTDGVARSDDLDAKSPLLRLGGAGRIDLPREHIDYTVRATVASTLQGQDGAELAALKGVTVPVALSGPFSAVDWNVRWSQMAGAVVQEKAREKIDAAREKLEGRVAERLRDKLGLPAAASGAEAASAPSLKEQARDKLKDKLKGFLR